MPIIKNAVRSEERHGAATQPELSETSTQDPEPARNNRHKTPHQSPRLT